MHQPSDVIYGRVTRNAFTRFVNFLLGASSSRSIKELDVRNAGCWCVIQWGAAGSSGDPGDKDVQDGCQWMIDTLKHHDLLYEEVHTAYSTHSVLASTPMARSYRILDVRTLTTKLMLLGYINLDWPKLPPMPDGAPHRGRNVINPKGRRRTQDV